MSEIVPWRTRHGELLALLPYVAEVLQNRLGELEIDEHVRRCLDSEEPENLVDLGQLLLLNDHNRGYEDDSVLTQLEELTLSAKRDFVPIHTLSSQPQLGTSVSAVMSIAIDGGQRVFVLKCIPKLAAARVHGQTSIANERRILHQAVKEQRSDVVRMLAAVQSAEDLGLLLEYLPAGDLGLLIEERKRLPEAWSRLWVAQTLVTLRWLNGLGYAHRDIKPANILLGSHGHIKLTDFGSAAPLVTIGGEQYVDKRFCLTPVGTVDYIAPEILEAHEAALEQSDVSLMDNEPFTGPYTAAVDIWSVGITLYEMITGTLPFYADTVPETYERIIRHQIELHPLRPEQGTSKELDDFLLRLLCPAGERMTHSRIVTHPFFSGLQWEAISKGQGPYIPKPRPLTMSLQEESRERSKAFDFSALFSSPGLSILRPERDSAATDTRWLGFTYLLDPGGIAQLGGLPVALEQLRLHPAGVAAKNQHLTTPARSSVSPWSQQSSKQRRHQKASGLKEVVNYGILRTAKKASVAATKVTAKSKDGRPQPGVCDPVVLAGLEKRHRDLVAEIEQMQLKYDDLFAAAAEATRT